jgi:hypothetical protein
MQVDKAARLRPIGSGAAAFAALRAAKAGGPEGIRFEPFQDPIGAEALFKTLEEWNEKLVRVCPNLGEPSP